MLEIIIIITLTLIIILMLDCHYGIVVCRDSGGCKSCTEQHAGRHWLLLWYLPHQGARQDHSKSGSRAIHCCAQPLLLPKRLPVGRGLSPGTALGKPPRPPSPPCRSTMSTPCMCMCIVCSESLLYTLSRLSSVSLLTPSRHTLLIRCAVSCRRLTQPPNPLLHCLHCSSLDY